MIQLLRIHPNPSEHFTQKKRQKKIQAELGWEMREDSGRGWRHVVPSPKPRHVCDISLVQVLARRGTVVIAGGGGGIPVIRKRRGIRHGVRAVIDKDLTSAHMANVLGIPILMILTSVPQVFINFGSKDQEALHTVSLREIKKFHKDGQFSPGSMGPKIEAAIRFLEGGGEKVIISHLEDAMVALSGETGTHISADRD